MFGQTVSVVREDWVRVGGGLDRTGARVVAFGSTRNDVFTGPTGDDSETTVQRTSNKIAEKARYLKGQGEAI